MPSNLILPTRLGVAVLAIGLWMYRRDVALSWRDGGAWVALGPVFVAAALAAFSGEHFILAKGIAQLVPKFLPGHLFIAYFVGVAHLAAALSFIARRYVRWSSLCLVIMFALFVLLMDLPGAMKNPTVRLSWILAAREGTFAMGALALFSREIRSAGLAAVARVWTALVVIFYGVEHILHPELSPGVPDSMVTAKWVPAPLGLAYLTGALLIGFGGAMLVRRFASRAGALAGLLMLILTLLLYVPEFFTANSFDTYLTAINFTFDTLLFAGTLLLVAGASVEGERERIAVSQTAG